MKFDENVRLFFFSNLMNHNKNEHSFETEILLKMEYLIERFPHIAEQIFQQLDNKSLSICREVNKVWKNFIDERNYPWIRIVQIPTLLTRGKFK